MSPSPLTSGAPLLLILLLPTGCITSRAPVHYTQDSATAGCLRNPACFTTLPGEEAVIPWLSHARGATRVATAVAMMLDGAQVRLVEQILTECAQKAHQQVNDADEQLRGQEPTREQCRQVVRMEGDKEVTRAMELGARKHELALHCAREAISERFTQNVSVEATYQKDSNTGLWRWLDPKQIQEWLQLGLTSALWGALVPDVVIHASGNPNQVQRVYDFKFPCPSNNRPSWRQYTRGQPHYPNDQGTMYKKALLEGKGDPSAVTPRGLQ